MPLLLACTTGADISSRSGDTATGPERETGVETIDGYNRDSCQPEAEDAFVEEGEQVSLVFTCSKTDSGETFTPRDAPEGASWDEASRTLTWTPGLSDGGRVDVHVIAEDGAGGVEYGTGTIWVADAFDAPGNEPIADQASYELEFGLPVMFLEKPENVGKYNEVETTMTYGGHTYEVGLQVRGAASTYYPKNSYKIAFDAEDEFDDPSLGFDTRRNIVLTTTFDDNAYFRQVLCFQVWNWLDSTRQQISADFVVVYMNGEYHGVYAITDHIDGEWWEEFDYDEDASLYKTVDHAANFYSTYGGYPKSTWHDGIEKKEGTEDDWTDIDALVQFVAESTDDDFSGDIDEMLDLSEFYDWWTLVVYLEADDSGGKNAYLYLDPTTDLWHFAPWDFNHSLGQTWQTEREPATYDWDFTSANNLFLRLLADAEYGAAMRARFYAALDGPLAAEAMDAWMVATWDEIRPNALRDWRKWGDQYRSYSGWSWRDDWTEPDEEVEYVRAWVAERHAYITETWRP